MKILFIDSETNGLPKNYKAKISDFDNWPRVIQLAHILTDAEGNILNECVDLIRPDEWQIPNEPFWINNGFTQESSLANGIRIGDSLKKFIDQVNESDVIVAHNLNFDYNVIGAELLRVGYKGNRKKEKVCTMTVGTDLLKMPGRFEGTYKFPKLEELYRYLFGLELQGAHDALKDTRACMQCFFELMNRRHIKLNDAVSV
jgi:DNA polymerase III epsilon subunit-like protein